MRKPFLYSEETLEGRAADWLAMIER